MKEKAKNRLDIAKEEIGDFWRKNKNAVLIVGLALGSYATGVYLGYKTTCARVNAGMSMVMLTYPDRPIKEFKQAVIDFGNEFKSLNV